MVQMLTIKVKSNYQIRTIHKKVSVKLCTIDVFILLLLRQEEHDRDGGGRGGGALFLALLATFGDVW